MYKIKKLWYDKISFCHNIGIADHNGSADQILGFEEEAFLIDIIQSFSHCMDCRRADLHSQILLLSQK